MDYPSATSLIRHVSNSGASVLVRYVTIIVKYLTIVKSKMKYFFVQIVESQKSPETIWFRGSIYSLVSGNARFNLRFFKYDLICFRC